MPPLYLLLTSFVCYPLGSFLIQKTLDGGGAMGNRIMLRQMFDEYQCEQIKQDGEKCFIASSGFHIRMKYNCGRLFQYASPRAQFAEAFALMFKGSSIARHITVLVGPESIGPFLGELQHYYMFKEARIALAKKDGKGGFVLEDSLDVRPQDCCLLVDDVLTTGKTLCGIRDAVVHRKYIGTAHGHPDIAGSAVIVDRTPTTGLLWHRVPEPIVSLLYDREHPVYAPSSCPFCCSKSK